MRGLKHFVFLGTRNLGCRIRRLRYLSSSEGTLFRPLAVRTSRPKFDLFRTGEPVVKQAIL